MTSIKETGESTISDLEGAYKSLLWNIEIESNKLKERAERDSSQIITEAKEKAEQTAEQLREEAKLESARIITEAKEKISQVITEVIVNSITRATNDLTRSASKVRSELDSKASEILSKLSDVKNKDVDDTRLFKGQIKVEIAYPSFSEEQPSMQEELIRVPGLKILSTDSYARGNRQIMAHIIELEEPVPLLETIKAAMQVKDIAEHEGNILVTSR